MDEIATIKHEVKMNEWNRQVMSWRESGLSATAWCKQENIPSSTFFYRLKQVRMYLLDDVNKGDCIFEQLPVLSKTHPIDTTNVTSDITLHLNGLDIDISSGTDENTIATVLRAVKSAW